MFNMILHFKFIYNPKKNYNYDNLHNLLIVLSPQQDIINRIHSEACTQGITTMIIFLKTKNIEP
jgi:hypothetical protein